MKKFRLYINIFMIIILSGFIFVLINCSAGSNLDTVNKVELKSYLGDWYEIAKYPTSFENRCQACAMANYKIPPEDADYDIVVTNSCKLMQIFI
ncbi:MAG: lipocalin family protein [bacterium]